MNNPLSKASAEQGRRIETAFDVSRPSSSLILSPRRDDFFGRFQLISSGFRQTLIVDSSHVFLRARKGEGGLNAPSNCIYVGHEEREGGGRGVVTCKKRAEVGEERSVRASDSYVEREKPFLGSGGKEVN